MKKIIEFYCTLKSVTRVLHSTSGNRVPKNTLDISFPFVTSTKNLSFSPWSSFTIRTARLRSSRRYVHVNIYGENSTWNCAMYHLTSHIQHPCNHTTPHSFIPSLYYISCTQNPYTWLSHLQPLRSAVPWVISFSLENWCPWQF